MNSFLDFLRRVTIKPRFCKYLHKLYKVLRVVLVVLVPHLGMPTANLPAVGIYNFIRWRAAAMRPLATGTVATCY